MTDATHNQLEQAFSLIQRDELDKALTILRPIVAAQPDNADAWWLLANAVSDPYEAQDALDNVLRLNPNHSQAREQRTALANEFPELAASPSLASAADETSYDNFGDLFGSTPEPADTAAASPDFGTLDDFFGSTPEPVDSADAFPKDDLFSSGSTFQPDADLDALFGDANRELDTLNEDPFASTSGEPDFIREAIEPAVPEVKPERPEKKPKQPKVKEPPQPLDPLEIERRANSRTSPFVRILVVLLIVLVIGGGVGAAYLSGLFGNRNGPQQTPVPVTAVGMGATAPATEAASGSFQSIVKLFTDSQYTNVQAAVVQSSLGDTLQVQVCGAPGPSLQTKVNQAMDMIATEAARMRDTIKAAGIQFVSCANPGVKLYRAIVPISAVTAYVDGAKKDHRAFRAAWKTT